MMKRYAVSVVLFSTISMYAMELKQQDNQDYTIAAMVETDGQETKTITGGPLDVKEVLRELIKNKNGKKSRVKMLRIEKTTSSARASTENIIDPISCQQAIDEITKIYKD